MYTFEDHIADWKKEKSWEWERFSFSDDLRGVCPALDVDDNYQTTSILMRNKVIDKGTKTDSETSCFYIYFNTKKGAVNFIKRLNEFVDNSNKNDVHKCPTCGREV